MFLENRVSRYGEANACETVCSHGTVETIPLDARVVRLAAQLAGRVIRVKPLVKPRGSPVEYPLGSAPRER